MSEVNNTEATADDFAKVQEFIKEQVTEHFKELSQTLPQVPAAQPRETEQDIAKRQIGELIDPFVSPGIQEAKFAAADARDYVDFYQSTVDAVEYKDQVEQLFKQLKDAGRPTTRADILRYIRGKEYESDPDKFTQRQSELRKRQLERASGAVDLGASAAQREKADSQFKNFDSMTVDEMEKALEGVAF